MFEILLWLSGCFFGLGIGVIIGAIAGAQIHHKYEKRNCRGKEK
jgi:gas vesicle protein